MGLLPSKFIVPLRERGARGAAAILRHEHAKATEPEQKAGAKKPRTKGGKTST